MAQKIQILLEDDVVGGTATQTITFGIDGVTYEIDLNDENAAKLRDSLATWVANARKASRPSGARGGRRRAGAGASRGTASLERTWLLENGYEVSSRGRIPAHLKEVYARAH